MAYADEMTDKQRGYLLSLAQAALADIEILEDLDPYIGPIYGCVAERLNRGQAGMLIDDLLVELGEKEGPLEHESIFGVRVPQSYMEHG